MEFHYFIVVLVLLFVQKTSATTFYINDASLKGDTYISAIEDGDTIIIAILSYKDLFTNGILLFDISKKVKFTILGITDSNILKMPPPSNQKVFPTEFYIENDKPIDRDAYLRNLITH